MSNRGQVIGYVGRSGLATGPHVCFRFWQNGRQVNHRKLKFPDPKPLDSIYLQEFYAQKRILDEKMNKVQLSIAQKKRQHP